MNGKKITYGDIAHLLESEGFRQGVVPESHVVFEHAAAGTSLLLPIHKSSASAAPRHVAMVKQTLVDFGIMSESDFNRWVANPKHFQAA